MTSSEAISESGQRPKNGAAAVGVADRVRALILRQELLPGMHIGQESLSVDLGVSRLPVREALKQLTAEGLVEHRFNRGYFVLSLSGSELRELYWLRGAVEDELVRRIVWPTTEQLDRITECETRVREAWSMEERVRFNTDFHFAIFDLALDKILIRELRRWWNMTTAYRALSLSLNFAEGVLVADHRELLRCLEDKDRDGLIDISRSHRKYTVDRLATLLPTESLAPPLDERTR